MTSHLAQAPPPTRGCILSTYGEPLRYRVIRGAQLINSHLPVEKSVLEGGRVVKQRLGVGNADLIAMARNSNQAAIRGMPPAIQLGHTPFDLNVPEFSLPRPVGYCDNFLNSSTQTGKCFGS